MTRHTYAQNNFTSGRLGKKSQGRTEIGQYKNGLDEMLNFLPYKSGGTRLRPGIRVVERIEVEDTDPQLVLFDINTTDRDYILMITKPDSGSPFYIMERDDYEEHVHKRTQTLGSGSEFVNIVTLNTELDYPQQSSAFGTAPPDVSTWRVLQAQDNYIITNLTSDIEPLFLILTDADGGGEKWWLTEYVNAKLVQNRQLKQHSAYALGYPYAKNRDNAAELTRTGTSPTDTFVVTGPSGFFQDKHVDSFIRVVPNGLTDELTYYIESRAGDTITVVAAVGNQNVWNNTTATANWALSDWNHGDGYPRLLSSYEQRVVFAATRTLTNQMWFSSPSDSFILTVNKLIQDTDLNNSGLGYFGDITDAFAFDLRISSNDLVEITWLISQEALLVGTRTSEYRVIGAEGLFGPLTNQAVIQTNHGSTEVTPQTADRSGLFVSRNGQELKEMGFSNDAKAYVVRTLSTLVDEFISEAGDFTDVFIKKIVWIAEDYTCWILLSDGSLLGMVKENNWEVLAWFNTDNGLGLEVEDISAFEQTDIGKDELRLLIRGDSDNEFYHCILTQEYQEDTAKYFETVGNEHPFQFRHLDFSAMDASKAVLDNDVFDDGTDVLTVNGTGKLSSHERLRYNGPDWGALEDGDIVYVDPVTHTPGGQIETYQISSTILGVPLSLPAPTGTGTLTGDGFEAIRDRFQLSDFNTDVVVLGDNGAGFELVGEFPWDLTNPADPIIFLGSTWKRILYGYKYKGRLKTLNFEPNQMGQYNNLQMMHKRIDKVLFKLHRFFGADLGSQDENMYPLELPVDFEQVNLQFFTGDAIMEWDATSGEQQRIILEVEGFGPVGVLGLYIRAFMGAT